MDSRRLRFVETCQRILGKVPSSGNAGSTAEEDVAAVLEDGEHEWVERFALVTGVGEGRSVHLVESMEALAGKLGFLAGGSVFCEVALELVDLDSGDSYWPRWETLGWST